MNKQVTHSRQEETPEAKARWFQSLSQKDRTELLVSFTDLILDINPKIVEQKIVKPVKGRIRVVSKP
jgi:hypothetical protein